MSRSPLPTTTTPPETPLTTIPLDVARGEKPSLALDVAEESEAEGELIKIDGAIRVLLRMTDSLEESGATAVSYLAMQLDDHVAALKRVIERGRCKREMAEPLPRPDFDARLDAFSLCREAARAWARVTERPAGTPGREEAQANANRLQLEISQLRSRIVAKPAKTLDDAAVLAILALFSCRGVAAELVKEAGELDEPDDLCSNDRALLALLLAVLEVLGIRLDTFAHA
jgi:hypothetical protein